MLFNRNLTKWIPLGNYGHGTEDYLVFVRGNIKTGMLYFKVKKVHPWTLGTNRILSNTLLDSTKQWNEIINMINPDNNVG